MQNAKQEKGGTLTSAVVVEEGVMPGAIDEDICGVDDAQAP